MERLRILILVLGISAGLVGCAEPPGEDLSKKAPQENADLEKGKRAETLKDWAAANPNNGAPGSGEGGAK